MSGGTRGRGSRPAALGETSVFAAAAPSPSPALQELARRELARRRYGEYLRYVGGKEWRATRFSTFLARRIQDFIEGDSGNAYDILLIESPPQHGKSMTVTESLPSWYLGRHPGRRVILASYNDESAERFARRNREKLRDFGGVLFGVGLGEVKRKNEIEVVGIRGGALPSQGGTLGNRALGGPALLGESPATQGNRDSGDRALGGPALLGESSTARGHGTLISRGIQAGITGRPADLLIIDDPIKNRAEADSPTTRRKIWEEWLNSLKTRLSAGAKVVVIMTPWHEDDLAGRLQLAEPGLQVLRLPVEAEEGDPMGRAPGDPLCPELGKDGRWLAQFKDSYLHDPEGGARAWAALYQCSPRTEGGNLVHREWWRRYRKDPGAVWPTTVISVDAAFKGSEDNDFVAIEVWSKRGQDYYLRYCLNRHLDFPETLAALRRTWVDYPEAAAVLIEDKANGSAIISVLQREMFCVPVNPKGGKESRVHAVSGAIESGHVFLPEGESWVEEFIEQFSAFPAGKHDDMVDAASQALTYLIWSSGESPAPETPEVREEFFDEYNVYG